MSDKTIKQLTTELTSLQPDDWFIAQRDSDNETGKVRASVIAGDGWIKTPDTWVYASTTTFTIAGVDRTTQFPVGTKIKLTQTTTKYFYVTGSSFSTNTTITITGGSDYSLANATIASPAVSYGVNPQGFPASFAYSPTLTNVTEGSGTKVASFSMQGSQVFCKGNFTLGSGSSVTGTLSIALPVTASTTGMSSEFPLAGGAAVYDPGNAVYPCTPEYSNSTTFRLSVFVTSSGSNPVYITSNSKVANGTPISFGTSDNFSWDFSYRAAP